MAETLPPPHALETLPPPDEVPVSASTAPLAHPPTAPRPARASESPAPAGVPEQHGLAPGVVIDGQNELIRELGRGGMGVVYLARDIRLGRKVAVKFVLLRSKQARQRFLAAARTTARYTPPNIVVIHEADEFNELPYMVLEFLPGKTLRQVMDEAGGRRGPSVARTLELMLPVLRALE